jgi:hypothetical protein
MGYMVLRRFTYVPTYECLRRCLGNDKWCVAYPNSAVYNLPIILSDHALTLTITQLWLLNKKQILSFKDGGCLKMDFKEQIIRF